VSNGNPRASSAPALKGDFDRIFAAAPSSAVFAEYCRRVYGAPLPLLDMLDVGELDALTRMLALAPGDRVADLGCGAGAIAEVLSDRTGAAVTGLDFAPSAIRSARDRTADRADRLRFVEGELDELDLEPGIWHAVLAVDSLYFARDLDAVVGRILSLLGPGGRFVAYFTARQREGDGPGVLEEGGTRLARALAARARGWSAVDQTALQGQIFRRSLDACAELGEAFEAEGLGWLAEGRVREAKEMLRLQAEGAVRRYRYVVVAE
jgi:SAM-dependent methyltransferase